MKKRIACSVTVIMAMAGSVFADCWRFNGERFCNGDGLRPDGSAGYVSAGQRRQNEILPWPDLELQNAERRDELAHQDEQRRQDDMQIELEQLKRKVSNLEN